VWHEDNEKKRGRKKEAKLMKEAHKRNKEQEKGEYKNVSGALLS